MSKSLNLKRTVPDTRAINKRLHTTWYINSLKTKHRLLYLKSPVLTAQ